MVLKTDRFMRINQRTRRRPFGDDDYETNGRGDQGRPKTSEPTKKERAEVDDEILDEEKGQGSDT